MVLARNCHDLNFVFVASPYCSVEPGMWKEVAAEGEVERSV